MKQLVMIAAFAALASAVDGARAATNVMELVPEPEAAVEALGKGAHLSRSPSGVVTLQCRTDEQQVLANCEVAAEVPENAGLGRAALSLAPNYRASAAGPVEVTVRFKAFEGARWIRKPSNSDLPKAMKAAKIRETDGRGVVECRVGLDGLLKDCRVKSSIPDPRFGEAALWLTPHFAMRPATYDGRPVEGRIVIPLTFKWG